MHDEYVKYVNIILTYCCFRNNDDIYSLINIITHKSQYYGFILMSYTLNIVIRHLFICVHKYAKYDIS